MMCVTIQGDTKKEEWPYANMSNKSHKQTTHRRPSHDEQPMGFADKKAGIGEGNAEVFPLVLDDTLIGYELKAKRY